MEASEGVGALTWRAQLPVGWRGLPGDAATLQVFRPSQAVVGKACRCPARAGPWCPGAAPASSACWGLGRCTGAAGSPPGTGPRWCAASSCPHPCLQGSRCWSVQVRLLECESASWGIISIHSPPIALAPPPEHSVGIRRRLDACQRVNTFSFQLLLHVSMRPASKFSSPQPSTPVGKTWQSFSC